MKRDTSTNTLDCRQAQRLLDEYAGDELASIQSAAIETHLARCEACRAEYSALILSRRALSHYPQMEASPDFDARVLDRLLRQNAEPSSFFDRLDAIFARPLYKLMGSAVLSVLFGLTAVAIVVGPHSLFDGVRSGTSEPDAPVPALTAATINEETLHRLYASGRLYPELWRSEERRSPRPLAPNITKGGEPAWETSKKYSPAASGFSYSAPSGSSC